MKNDRPSYIFDSDNSEKLMPVQFVVWVTNLILNAKVIIQYCRHK